MNRIRSGDTVIVVTGKSKGHIGSVKKVIDDMVIVENANMITKSVKPNPQIDQKGGLIKLEAPIHISNVAIYNTQTNKKDRVGFRFVEKDGNRVKVRFYKSNDQQIDN